MVNVCSQNQQIRLLDPRFHIELIDGYAGNKIQREQYIEAYTGWTVAAERLSAAIAAREQGERKRAETELLVSELSQLKPRPGMRDELEARVKQLSNGERILTVSQSIAGELAGDGGLFGTLQLLTARVSELVKLDPIFEPTASLFASARAELKEFEADLGHYLATIELDEEALRDLRDRLAEVARLERKYRTDSAGLAALLEAGEAQLRAMDGAQNLAGLEVEAERLRTEAERAADRLSKTRKDAAKQLCGLAGRELAELNMKGACLECRFEEAPLGPAGRDRAGLWFGANKGEPLKELREIASGGELSRLMLVLKKTLRDRTGVNVLIFDEVDSGVSGGVARAVGAKLKELSEYSQVICITHLPQVASLADHHFVVDKRSGKRTVSQVRQVVGDDRIEEIARMLAGYTVTAAARESARELLSSKV